MPTKTKKTDSIIYINELCRIVNRKRNTIYKWEHQGRLPRHLLPKRGKKNWRYWTYDQVYGPNGIIAWVKKNDMRPGNLITDPSKEAEHITALRRPKYLKTVHINQALDYIEKGWGAKKIAQKLLPDTRYKRWQNVDRALRAYFEVEGWGYPLPDEQEEQVKKLVQRFDSAVSSGDDERAIKLVIR
jgi:hypothetical protein